MRNERKGELFMMGHSLLESLFPIFSFVVVSSIGALYTYAILLLISLICFAFIMLRKKLFQELQNTKGYKYLFWTSVWIACMYILLFVGVRYTTAGNMPVILLFQLFFSYLYFNIFGKDKLGLLHTIGAFIMGIGGMIILFPTNLSFNKGDLLFVLAAAIIPIVNVYAKSARNFYSSETILGIRTLIALPVISIMAYLFDSTVTIENIQKILPHLLFMGIFIFVVSKIFLLEALHYISVTKSSAMVSIEPLITLIIAYFYLHEVLKIYQMVGVAFVLIGGYFLTKSIE